MSVATRAIFFCRAFVLVTLFTMGVGLTHAAPATAQSKVGVQKKSVILPIPTKTLKPVIKTYRPVIKTNRPVINKNLVPQKKIKQIQQPQAVKPFGQLPTFNPSIPTRRGSIPSPAPNDPGSGQPSEAEPGAEYEEPYYDEYNDQEYYGGGGYGSPGEYYPESGEGYYEQPGYAEPEPAPQPFRGVQGSLLDQQQFEFKPLAELSPSSPQAGNESERPYEPGQVLVVTKNMDDAKQLQQAVASAGYRPKSRTKLSQLGFVLTIFRLPADVSVVDAVAQLKEAFPGFLVSANTRYTSLAIGGKKKNYAKAQINWNTANARCAGKLRIGLLDGEIDTGHPQLATSNIRASSVLPAGVSKKRSDHGTAIANLLVGGKEGLLQNAELFAVNVFRNTNGKPDTTTAWVIKALNSLLEKNVKVINMSLGGARDELLEYAAKTVSGKQVLMVAAAGNDGPEGQPAYPAAYPDVIAVTAVDAREKIFRKANKGDYIDISAPGVDIWSISSRKGRYYTGTSFAAPFVTAALSVLRTQYPAETVVQLKSRLMQRAKDLGNKGKDPVYGQGLLNTQGLCPD